MSLAQRGLNVSGADARLREELRTVLPRERVRVAEIPADCQLVV